MIVNSFRERLAMVVDDKMTTIDDIEDSFHGIEATIARNSEIAMADKTINGNKNVETQTFTYGEVLNSLSNMPKGLLDQPFKIEGMQKEYSVVGINDTSLPIFEISDKSSAGRNNRK